MVDFNSLWFNTPDVATLCRNGGNGPNHPSQLYAIKKYYTNPTWTFLDYGCGSATTTEAILKADIAMINYLGLDIIPKNIKWCKEQYPEREDENRSIYQIDFQVNHSIHKIDAPDKLVDVVYSRHVVDHMKSFEDAMDEHCRVAKKLVIVVLWVPFAEDHEHHIKNIVDQPGLPTEKLYPDEYTNQYSRKKVLEYLHNKKGWKCLEITEGIKGDGVAANHDVVIVLKHE